MKSKITLEFYVSSGRLMPLADYRISAELRGGMLTLRIGDQHYIDLTLSQYGGQPRGGDTIRIHLDTDIEEWEAADPVQLSGRVS